MFSACAFGLADSDPSAEQIVVKYNGTQARVTVTA